MFRDKEEELQRLEQLLAEAEEEDQDESDEEEYEEDFDDEDFDEEEFDEEELIREFSDDTDATALFTSHRDIRVYNSDKTDVDIEKYSDDVFSGSRPPVLPWVFAALTAVVLLMLYLALKQGGYLG